MRQSLQLARWKYEYGLSLAFSLCGAPILFKGLIVLQFPLMSDNSVYPFELTCVNQLFIAKIDLCFSKSYGRYETDHGVLIMD